MVMTNKLDGVSDDSVKHGDNPYFFVIVMMGYVVIVMMVVISIDVKW